MGLNVNLCRMIGAPYELGCPNCGRTFHTYFEHYDIECGRSNPRPSKWELSTHCPHCKTDLVFELLLLAADVSLKKR